MKKIKENDEIFVLKNDTPYHNALDWFYEDMGFLRSVKDPAIAYRLSRIKNLDKWFTRTTPEQFTKDMFGRE